MAEIRLSGINKVYPDGTHAVHDVDLHIADGEFMIMVGPSGCAKSTILRMIAGLEVPTSGTVEIGGRVVNDVPPKDRDIAMVFQSYALYPHMTVRDNMAFGLKLRRMPEGEIQQRVDEAARILGLEALLDRLPKQMSGGQRQRVAMGRAIVREPQAFMMDEPLSNLDAKLRVQMRTQIAKLHQRLATTTVYVTHDQVEAMTLGQRICILRKGVVQQVDTPFQVYSNPANVFVASFIGSPGMNFVSASLATTEQGPSLVIGQRVLPLPQSVTQRLLVEAPWDGRPVVVGVRPEHVHECWDGSEAGIPGSIDLVEALGAEAYAYVNVDVAVPDLSALSDTQAASETFVARLQGQVHPPTGAQVTIVPDLQQVHLFDPASQETLLAPVSQPQDQLDGQVDLGHQQPHEHYAQHEQYAPHEEYAQHEHYAQHEQYASHAEHAQHYAQQEHHAPPEHYGQQYQQEHAAHAAAAPPRRSEHAPLPDPFRGAPGHEQPLVGAEPLSFPSTGLRLGPSDGSSPVSIEYARPLFARAAAERAELAGGLGDVSGSTPQPAASHAATPESAPQPAPATEAAPTSGLRLPALGAGFGSDSPKLFASRPLFGGLENRHAGEQRDLPPS